MADNLDQPLKGKRAKRFSLPHIPFMRRARDLPLTRIGLGLLAVIVLGFVGRLWLVDTPEGGRPVAEVSISSDSGANTLVKDVAVAPEPGITPVTSNPGGPTIISVDENLPDSNFGASAGVAALTDFGVVPDLIEETPNGPIPRVGPKGETPFDTYRRTYLPMESGADRPMVAIIVTGLGLSETGTMDAIDKLPEDVTLAFAPYGDVLQKTGTAARAAGHELMLQVPLEPFDYPQNDPGPQTLLTGQAPRANLDKLFWLMARLGGYTGVINYMGARFTASAADMGPVMEELGTRGVGYVDDGSSNRSVAANLARNNHVPFRRADVEIDVVPARADIEAALEKLTSLAKANGSALGVASALPITLDIVAQWASELDSQGITLVPASVLMAASSENN